MKKVKVLVLTFGLLVTAYTGHRAILWGNEYAAAQERKIACGWLGEKLLTSHDKKHEKSFAQVMSFVESQCWTKR